MGYKENKSLKRKTMAFQSGDRELLKCAQTLLIVIIPSKLEYKKNLEQKLICDDIRGAYNDMKNITGCNETSTHEKLPVSTLRVFKSVLQYLLCSFPSNGTVEMTENQVLERPRYMVLMLLAHKS